MKRNAWRWALLAGTLTAVALWTASLYEGSTTRRAVVSYGKLDERNYGQVPAHQAQARYLRDAAGAVLLITLASLPLLGLGSHRQPPAAPPDSPS